MANVSVILTAYLQELLALKLRGHTPETLHRSLENPSEPLSASTVWGAKPSFRLCKMASPEVTKQAEVEPFDSVIQGGAHTVDVGEVGDGDAVKAGKFSLNIFS